MYQYALEIRPFGIGCYPTENYVQWIASNEYKFGIMEYKCKIPLKEIEHFSLVPITELEELDGKKVIFFAEHEGVIKINKRNGQIYGASICYVIEDEPDEIPTSRMELLRKIESGDYKLIN